MKKRLISLSLVTILALCLVFPLSACGKNKEKLMYEMAKEPLEENTEVEE